MFIDRRVFRVKVGRMQEMLAIANAERVRSQQKYSNAGEFRYMVGLVADFDVFVFESKWNSLADWEKYWQEWGADPESAAFLEKIWETMESGGEHQLWQIVE